MKLMLTRFVAVLIGLVSFLPSSVMAYKLGAGVVESSYQQPLRIKFELVREQVLFDAKLSVGLASKEIFASQNLEYLSGFDELVFRVESSDSGPSHLIIESPIIFPLNELSLLLRLSWKKTSLLSRVDVILNTDFSGVIFISLDEKGEIRSYQVTSGDNLWRIARAMRTNKASVWQVMDAIYVKNPDAFLDQDPEQIIIGSQLEKPSEQFIAAQTGTLVSLIIDGSTATSVEMSAASEEANKEEVALDQKTADFDLVNPSEDLKIPYFEATDIKSVSDALDAEVIAGDSVDIESERVSDGDVVDIESDSLPSNSTNDDLERLNTALIQAQDNIMSAQMEASALRAKVEMLQAQIASLDQQLINEQQEKQAAIDLVEQLRGKSAEAASDDLVRITAAVIAVFMLGAVFVYVFRVRQRRAGVKDEAVIASGATADQAEDIFADMDTESGDVFADDNQTTQFPGLDELEQVADPELSAMDDMEYLDQSDNINPVDVKLDLAQTYADLGDISGAKEILEEIISEANKEGKARAQAVLDALESDS
jgi:FimV-like protein